ncbi:hypothetical protein G6F62_015792 [Rhizopus arrhizus]|nr:hypothetical protein G6F62_015792 [Rhizopus arrhizus]
MPVLEPVTRMRRPFRSSIIAVSLRVFLFSAMGLGDQARLAMAGYADGNVKPTASSAGPCSPYSGALCQGVAIWSVMRLICSI